MIENPVKDYLTKIGRTGGKKTSVKKWLSSFARLEKAREAKAKKREEANAK
jgi:hypothetical protein